MEKDFISSKELAGLREEMVGVISVIPFLQQVFQMEVILDANIVLRDLIWTTTKRKNKNAKTDLQEVLEAETVIAIAPIFLKHEVEKHLPTISSLHRVAIEELEKEWRKLSNFIEFHTEIDDLDISLTDVRDPNDLPYIKLQIKTGAPIRTEDKDIPAMNGITISAQVIASLKDYSRHAAVEYTFKLQGVSLITFSSVAIVSIFKFVIHMTKSLGKLPSWILWTAVIALIVGLLFPLTREAILGWIGTLSYKLKSLGEDVVELLMPHFKGHDEAKSRADKLRREINV